MPEEIKRYAARERVKSGLAAFLYCSVSGRKRWQQVRQVVKTKFCRSKWKRGKNERDRI